MSVRSSADTDISSRETPDSCNAAALAVCGQCPPAKIGDGQQWFPIILGAVVQFGGHLGSHVAGDFTGIFRKPGKFSAQLFEEQRWPRPFGQIGGPTKLIPDHAHAASGMDDTVSGVYPGDGVVAI